MAVGPRGLPGALCAGSRLPHDDKFWIVHGGGGDGVSGDLAIGKGWRRGLEFVWQLTTVEDDGPGPIASRPTPEDPHPARFKPS